MKIAEHPFQFVTASHLTRIGNQRANTLGELRDGLEGCGDACIFYHTFQSLERHHFLTEGFSNDFAQWVLAALNRAELAEGLTALDIRGYLALNDLRADLLRVTDEYCAGHPREVSQPAFEPFYFLESLEVAVPLAWHASTLEEFRQPLSGRRVGEIHGAALALLPRDN